MSAGCAYVPPPGSTGVVASFEDDGLEPAVSECFEHKNAALKKGISIYPVDLYQPQGGDHETH